MAAKYDAFISYKHSGTSRRVAIALEKALKRYARPLFAYPRRIFRDEQILRPGDDLSEGIKTALRNSEYLLYIATKEGAQSEWVRRELIYWCSDLKRSDRLIVIHAEDSIVFSEDRQAIDWEHSDALIPDLKDYFPSLPVLIDMSWLRVEEDGDLHNFRFKGLINGIVAKFRGVTPEELNGEEVRIYRRNRRLRNTAIVAISVLTIATSMLAVITTSQRNAALLELRANELMTYALQMEDSDHTKAFRLLAKAYETKDTLPIRKLIYDWYTTKTMYVRELSHPGRGVGKVDWSPNEDILVGNGSEATIWKNDGNEYTISPQAQAVVATSFYDEGRKVMTAGFSGVISGWDSKSGEELWGFPVGDQFSDASISPDGKYLVVLTLNSGDLVIRLADRKLMFSLNKNSDSADAVAFSADSKLFAIARKEKVIVYSIDGGEPKHKFSDLHRGTVESLAFSSDGRFLVSGSNDETAFLWDLHDEGWIHLQGQFSPINAVAITHDGKRIATGSRDGRIFIWDGKGSPLITIDAHRDEVRGLRFSPDGRWLISGGGTHERARIWSAENLDQSSTMMVIDAYETRSVEFSPDERHILTTGLEGKARIWDLKNKDNIRTLPAEGAIRGIYGSEGKFIAIIARDKVTIWNNTFELISEIEVKVIDGAFVNREGKVPLISLITPETLQLRNIDGSLVSEKTLQQRPKCIAVSPDGRWIVTGATDNTASIWDAELSLKAKLVGHNSHVSSVAFSNDNKYIATGSYDETAKIWDLKGRLLANLEGGHSSYIVSVAFSPDGQRLFTGGYELPGIGIIWDWKNGYFEKVLHGHATRILVGAFSPTGSLIATGDMDGTMRIWSSHPTLDDYLQSDRVALFTDLELGLTTAMDN